MTDINSLPQPYQDFLLNKFYKEEFINNINKEDINMMFNLHNNFLNTGKNESGRGCGSCVRRVYAKVKELTKDSYNQIIAAKQNVDDIIL